MLSSDIDHGKCKENGFTYHEIRIKKNLSLKYMINFDKNDLTNTSHQKVTERYILSRISAAKQTIMPKVYLRVSNGKQKIEQVLAANYRQSGKSQRKLHNAT